MQLINPVKAFLKRVNSWRLQVQETEAKEHDKKKLENLDEIERLLRHIAPSTRKPDK